MYQPKIKVESGLYDPNRICAAEQRSFCLKKGQALMRLTGWISSVKHLLKHSQHNNRRRGKWEYVIRGRYKVWNTLEDPRCRGMGMWRCSLCGHKTFGKSGSNYCSNCGAIMDKGKT